MPSLNLTNKKDSILVQNMEKMFEIRELVTTEESFRQDKAILKRFERAKQLKQQRYKYYDGMYFDEDYATNENLKNTYLTPRANETEVQVNAGTSEKKLDAIKNELLTMNLQHEIRANDQEDLEIVGLGENFSDIVTRTNQIEKDEDFWEDFIDELISQRVTYVREYLSSRTYKRGAQKEVMAKKEVRSGLQVFPGDWTIPANRWDDQPYIIDYDRVNYEYAKSLFGHLPNFAHVRSNKAERNEYLGGAFSYNFGELQDGEVEIVLYESLPDNEKQLYIGSVPMYAPGTKLDGSYNKYSLRAYIPKAMSRKFLGGRPFTAMAKFMQGFQNETIRMLIRKFQQALEPPLATPKGGKVYAKGIWDPSAVTQGLRKSDFEKMIDHTGVTQSEFDMYGLVEEKTKEFIGTPDIVQGLQGPQEKSATEILSLQKAFIKQLGLTVAALIRAKRDLTEMRVYNVVDNYLDATKRKFDPIAKQVQEVYRSFTLESANFENNRKGKKIIKFFDRDLTGNEKEELFNFEENEAKRGNNIRVRFINRNTIKSFPIYWHVIASIQDKEGTALDKVTFQDKLNQSTAITQITGKRVNPDVVTEDFERKWKAKDWFNVPAPQEENPDMTPEGEGVRKDSEGLLKEIEKSSQGSMGNQVSRGLRGGESSAQKSAVNLEANA